MLRFSIVLSNIGIFILMSKSVKNYRVNPNQFIKVNSKSIAYLLGLIWADGYVLSDNKRQRISIEMVKEDLKKLKPIFLSIGKWSVNCRNRQNKKPQMCIHTNNKILADFLIENDYTSKSNSPATKILNRIPKKFQSYWFRGLIDGDGCFYINKKRSMHQFNVSSSYNQDWCYMEDIFKKLKISYKIVKRKCLQRGKINKSSFVRITNKKDIVKFGNYIYNNYSKDKIGLLRKYKKFLSIKES